MLTFFCRTDESAGTSSRGGGSPNLRRFALRWFTLLCFAWLSTAQISLAISPLEIERGQQLFSQSWQDKNPFLGNDGLGPLFNAKACATCHHQGGLGGSGDSRFNAQTIGVERIRLANATRPAVGEVPKSDVAALMRKIHPGLVQSDETMVTTAPLPHFGGSETMQNLRTRFRQLATSQSAREGGAATPADVRENMTAAWKWSGTEGQASLEVEARLFQRNTPALFGAGLIDQISEKQLRQLARGQARHGEINGRVATTRTGGPGRFGWRGNVERLLAFVEQACANEMGLQSKRVEQPLDVGNPQYRNPGFDIDDDQLQSMAAFIAALPAPAQVMPEDSLIRETVLRGKQHFELVGCAACHVETVGPAVGIYSDLLLHDMGPQLYDYDAAEPYVVRADVTRTVVQTESVIQTYYGRATRAFSDTSRQSSTRLPTGDSRTPRASTAKRDTVVLARGKTGSIQTPGVSIHRRIVEEQIVMERTLRPSNVTQEWRTPPLWGVADSAPYLHDGRAETLLEAIMMHGGESEPTRARFMKLPWRDREALIAFLQTLRAPQNVPQIEEAS